MNTRRGGHSPGSFPGRVFSANDNVMEGNDMMTNEMNISMELKRIDICDLLIACDMAGDISGAEKWDLLHDKLAAILNKFDAEHLEK